MEQIKIGIAGLGRLGSVHAANLAFRIPGVQLAAACSPVEAELTRAREQFGITDTYTDYDEMLQKADIDAVAVVTPSVMHFEQITKAIRAGKHVFSDKPLGVDIEECRQACEEIEAHPDQVFFLGFMRRYDPSYAYAKQKVEEGAIGTPYLVKATSFDPESVVEGCIRYCRTSGGIFIDSGSHDMDLMRWFLGSDAVEVYATGATFKHPEFAEAGDCETGCAMFRFANGAIGMSHQGRICAEGYHIEHEIIGTEGSIRISPVPAKNMAMLYNASGAVVECVENFPERFEQAYLLEMQEFIDCIRTGRKPGVTAADGLKAIRMAFATTQSFRENHPVPIEY